MKTNTTTAIIAADKKATSYIQMMSPLQAKKVLFAMTLLKGDQRLSDSRSSEVRTIAGMYDGFVIQGKAAKELAAKLAKAYAEKYPRVLLTKKSIAQFTDARYRKLLEAVGEYGFDYVLEALRHGKAYVNNPGNNIDERQMLRALRWTERRENQNADESNAYHRKKGLQLAGLGDMADVLVEHSFAIANVYEMVEPAGTGNFLKPAGDLIPGEETVENQEDAQVNGRLPLTIREMKIHFIEKWGLLEDFYGSNKPVCPTGYSEEELVPDSVIVGLAHKGLLKDSQEVLAYVDMTGRYTGLMERMENEFSSDELDVIKGKPDKVKALISNAW